MTNLEQRIDKIIQLLEKAADKLIRLDCDASEISKDMREAINDLKSMIE